MTGLRTEYAIELSLFFASGANVLVLSMKTSESVTQRITGWPSSHSVMRGFLRSPRKAIGLSGPVGWK
jgi:hypothetical protein